MHPWTKRRLSRGSLPVSLTAEAVREKVRALVEARRDTKRVRYLDAE